MNHNKFKRTLVASSLAALLYTAAPAMAADTFGGTVKGVITNSADASLANATIVLKHKAKGVSRTIQTGADGAFTIRKLPVGNYTMTITKDGFTSVSEDIQVRVGGAIVLDSQLIAVNEDIETIEVRGSSIARVDTASSTGGLTVTAEELALMPIGDGFANIALLTPGVSKSTSFASNSFGGSSSAENGYYLNGLNVTNIRKGMGEINLPFEAIAQTQVKTGGIDPEFGGALGGVVNAISKSGSNDFEFVAQARFEPDSLRSHQDDLRRLDNSMLHNTKKETTDYTEYRLSASGPIIEDTLFAYALIQPERLEQSRRGDDAFNLESTEGVDLVRKTSSWFAKVDWYITEDHILEFTGIGFETKGDGKKFEATGSDWSLVDKPDYKTKTGGEVFGVKYTGYLADDITLDVIAGRTVEQDYNAALSNAPRVVDTRGLSDVTLSSHSNASIEDGKYTRDQFRADLTWDLDEHSFKFGVDHYKIDVDYISSPNGVDGALGWWSVNTSTGADDLSHQTPGEDFITKRIRTRLVQSEVNSTAIYLQDSWQATDQLVVNLGLRYSNQSNTISDGRKYVDLTGQLAPRLSTVYDLEGDGTSKVFATFGRYFQPVSANMNITQGSAQRETFNYYELGDVNANGTPVLLADGSPSVGAEIRDQRVRQQGIVEPGLIASSNLEGMYSDEITFGYEQEVNDGKMTAGVRFIYRELGTSLEDTDVGPVLAKKLAELGIDDNVGQGSYYILYNPGQDVSMAYDFNGDGTVDNVNMTADELQIPHPDRTYKALEFTLRGSVTDDLKINASYLWSHSQGMTEGLVKSDTDRAAPGWTTSYDYADIMDHGYGDLPNDRTHFIKLAGTYNITEDLVLGFSSRFASGTPVNKFGIHPKGVDSCASGSPWEDCISYYYGPYSFYDHQGNPAPRGTSGRTPWTAELDLSLTYMTTIADNNLTISAKVYNVFDAATTTKVDQINAIRDADSNIIANPEWNRTTDRITPRYATITARYEF